MLGDGKLNRKMFDAEQYNLVQRFKFINRDFYAYVSTNACSYAKNGTREGVKCTRYRPSRCNQDQKAIFFL